MTDAADGTAYKHQLAPFNPISGTGMTESSMLICRLFRDATNGSDTYNTDASASEFDFHFEVEKLGVDL